MRLGIFSVVDHYPGELGRTTAELYGELLEQVQAADELGFHSFWVAEHHFHEYGAIPRPPVWMAAAAERTRRIRLGSGVVVLPFDNPLRTAEDYAMVDVLSAGRLNLGVGSGYLAHEYAGFGVDADTKRERFHEALEILERAWSGERFSYEGRFHRVREVQLNVRPLQQPRPPIWIATLRSEGAMAIGARGYPVMLIPYASAESIDEIAAGVRAYQQAFVGAGGQLADATVPFGFHTHCADTTAQARAEARGAMDRYVRTRQYAKQRAFDLLIEKDLIAVGDPAEIVRVARRYAEAGLTDFLAITNFGGLPHKPVMRSMELMARHVLPELAALAPPTVPTASPGDRHGHSR
jgi:alkanesulfonate monooxygenase SsuD/methylene tetrahydromethanopterin reductase-like flavin-dependent oxidoreductase (luciferase family)